VVIVARGGGSLEDLWTFNEEAVARAIARSAVPVVSAVGHETDVTIADFVADLRAPTPSAAAELVICTRQQVFERIDASSGRLEKEIRHRLTSAARRLHELGVERATATFQRALGRRLQRVDELDYQLRERLRDKVERTRRCHRGLEERLGKLDLRLRLAGTRRRLEQAESVIGQGIRLRLVRERGRLDSLAAQLSELSPLGILDRGYAIVQNERGGVVKEAHAAPVDSSVTVRLAKGRLRAKVTQSIPAGSSELPS